MTADEIKKFYKKYKNWPYNNTFLLLVSLVLVYVFIDYPFVQNFILKIGSLGYLGAFLSGIFFVSAFTITPAAVILFDIANVLNPYIVAFLAGLGAVIGDYIIFRYLKDRIFYELAPIFNKAGGSWIKKVFMTPYFSWLLPLVGAFMIASPLPDEMGITMMGLSKIKTWQFVLVTFILNAIGIFLLVTFASIF